MRQGPNGRRGRGRPHPGSNGPSTGGQGGGHMGPGPGNAGPAAPQRRSAASLRNQSFDSNGPEGVRVRGNAWQVHEKYQTLARDAASASDRVAAENYQQHAEHYYRIIEAINEATAAEQQTRGFAPPQPGMSAPVAPQDPRYMPQPGLADGQQPETGNGGFAPQPGMNQSGMNQPAMNQQPITAPQAAQPAPQETTQQRGTGTTNSFFAPEGDDEDSDGNAQPAAFAATATR